MAEAPKIPRLIRERVLAQQAGFRSQAEHPDADVLTAFSENTLARDERSQVMNHLGACEACREVVMLTPTVSEQDAKPAKLAARPLLSWMTLRWASVAAVFAVAIGVVVMERSTKDGRSVLIQPGPTPQEAAPARAREQERQMANTAEPQAAEKDTRVADSKPGGKAIRKPAAVLPPPYVETRQGSIGPLSAGERRSQGKHAPLAKEDYFFVPNAANAKREMIIDRSVINSSEFRIEPSGVGLGAAQEPARPAAPESKTYTFGQAQTVPPPANSTVGGAVSATANNSIAPAEQAPARKKSTDEVSPKVGGFQALQRTGNRDDKAAAPQAEVASSSSDEVNFQASDQTAGLTTENLAAAGPVPMRWRLREGKLQHSADDGKTWQEVNLEPGINLHSLWIQGGTVWAGGTGGSLFHVTERGKNAVRIPLKVSGGGDVSQTVVTISFSDERHGVIRLENGQILRTSDGGKTWERF